MSSDISLLFLHHITNSQNVTVCSDDSSFQCDSSNYAAMKPYEISIDVLWSCTPSLHFIVIPYFCLLHRLLPAWSEIPVQEKPTIFNRTTSVIKPSNQGLKFVFPPSLLFQRALWIQHPLTANGFAWSPTTILLPSESYYQTTRIKVRADQLCNTPRRQIRQKNKTNTFLLAPPAAMLLQHKSEKKKFHFRENF